MSSTPRDPSTGRFTSSRNGSRLVKLKLLSNGQISFNKSSPSTTPSKPKPNSKQNLTRPIGSSSATSAASSRLVSNTPTPSSESKAKRKSARIAGKETISDKPIPQLGPSPEIREASGSPSSYATSETKSIPGTSVVAIRNGEKVFIEPELAEPKPIYTGLSLESYPSAKVKKESLWPAKYRRSNRTGSSQSTSREGSVVPGSGAESEVAEIEPEIEKVYKKELKTEWGERLVEESEVRNSATGGSAGRARPMRTAKLKLIIKTPKPTSTPRQKKRGGSNDVGSNNISPKRIKVISPKKPLGTNLSAPGAGSTTTNITKSSAMVATSTLQSEQNDDPTKDNDDFCFACGGPGVFICCETCPKSFHFTCCNTPIEEPPEDDWFCRECTTKRHPSMVKNWNDIGIFGALLNQNEVRDAKVFQLPRHLRDETFIGVSTGDNGDYSDDTMKPDIPVGKSGTSQIPGHNRNNDLDIESLYDKYGNPYLCHKCGESGLNNRSLMQCDYCPLVWHIDCLDEPMFGPKTIGNKWRCPNHIEQLFPPGFPKMRQFRDTKVLEGALHRNFLKIAAMSNIVIKFDDQPYLKPESTPELEEYLEYQSRDFMKSEKEFKDAKVLKRWGRDMDAIHPEYEVPDYFQTVSTKNGVAAIASNQLANVVSLTCPRKDGTKDSFIYRVPERLIILDFISKAKEQAEKKSQVMEEIDEYEHRQRVEIEHDESSAVEGLELMKKTQTKYANGRSIDFSELLKAASIAADEASQSSELGEDEIKELLQIKKLMEAKGKSKLLEFLQSS